MGWDSGTDVFDPVVKEVLKNCTQEQARPILKALFKALADQDWDTENESRYFNHPLVQEIYTELYPDAEPSDEEDYGDGSPPTDEYDDWEMDR